jgi:glucosamine 6-phosphate synthetase-like amidotransferase/phosphosugar isomerase protein
MTSGLDTGAQPLLSEDGKIILAVNGEIYNHIKLRAHCGSGYKFKTHSDCEVIIPLVRSVCVFLSITDKVMFLSTVNMTRISALYSMGCSPLSCSTSLSNPPES